MLWEYTLLLFLISFISLILAFDQNIEPIGKVFFMLLGGITFPAASMGMLKIDFNWGGSQNVVQYTFIPGQGAWIAYALTIVGVLLFMIGCIRSWELVLPKPKQTPIAIPMMTSVEN